jgi:hypothetical protein
MTAKNATVFAKYLARLLPDIASMCVTDAIGRDKALKDIPQLKEILSGR